MLVPNLVLATVALGAQAQGLTTAGTFAVSPSGAATYSIPLALPPAISGMEPKLSLAYNSQGGNGLLGMGWSLQGFSAITRCPQTIAQDNYRSGVKYDKDDRFCLDGQRLVMTAGTNYGDANSVYRTEKESFVRVTASSGAQNYDRAPLRQTCAWQPQTTCEPDYTYCDEWGCTTIPGTCTTVQVYVCTAPAQSTWGAMPLSFTVKTKAGLTMEYGGTADSRIRSAMPPSGLTRPIITWALSKVSDTAGNSYTITYCSESNYNTGDCGSTYVGTGNQLASGAEWLPIRIDYTFNAANGGTAPNKVQFFYDSARTDKLPAYRGGGLGKMTQRLTMIQALVGTAVVREYKVDYDNGGLAGNMRATAIKECNGASTQVCLPPVSLTQLPGASNNAWNTPTTNYVAAQNYPAPIGSVSYFGDFNGDGRTDILWDESNGYGAASSGGNRQIWLGQADGSFSVVSNAALQIGYYVQWKPFIGDFNGDGKSDILWEYVDVMGRYSLGQRSLWISNGDGTFAITNNVMSQNGTLVGYGRCWSDAYRQVWTSKGDGFGFDIIANLGGLDGSYQTYKINIGDFNGDGKSDIFWDYVYDIYCRTYATNRKLSLNQSRTHS